MKLLLIVFSITVVTRQVTSAICSFDSGKWKCRDVPFANITTLFVTDIPQSKIPVLNRGILKPFKNLVHIDIGECDIESIAPDTFIGFPLKSLHLNNNKIRKIEKGTLNSLNHTTSFEIFFNQLERLEDDTFLGMTSLSWMSLSGNKISKIERNAFNGLENLEALFLLSNEITSLETDTFKHLRKLSILELGSNPLKTLPFGLFSQLTNLQKLLLQHNKIETLPNTIFDNLTALNTLDVSENKISEFSDSLFGSVLENFSELKMYSNNISKFNAKQFFIWAPKIKSIELFDNPWSCAELERLRGEFLSKHVKSSIPVPAKKKPNVDGIPCEL